MDKKLNRIKVILADRGLTNRWLAETIHRDPATISKLVTNAIQPLSEEIIKEFHHILKTRTTDAQKCRKG